MHIKQITISNFRSFRQQPEIHPFHPGTNAVVGRNGSGKSNLFDAVQFVLLTPKFVNLRQEERQALLHEGAGSTAVNAFCELVFDNSDGRLSVDSDEVVVRRTIGLKKDEFFLQRKRATKREIASLLEGAGFSKGNPYYIVQQGKVNALCTMSSLDRLELLKEVAGCTVYDEKRADSLKQMEENEHSRAKINEVLEYIDTRLSELQGEKDELSEYQRLDRRRRAMEYTLYEKELRKARETLDQIEHERSEEVEKLSLMHDQAHQIHDHIRSIEMRMKQIVNKMRKTRHLIAADGTGLEAEHLAAVTRKTKLELEVKELEESLSADKKMKHQLLRDLKALDEEICVTQRDLDQVALPNFTKAKEIVDRLTKEKSDAHQKAEALYAKQGRGRQFRNQKDRDADLRRQIREIDSLLPLKKQELADWEAKISGLRRSVTADDNVIIKKQSEVSQNSEFMETLSTTIQEKIRARNELEEQRRASWRALQDLTEKVNEARETAKRCFGDLRKSMPRATAMGLDALQNIVQRERIPHNKYLGPVMENLRLVDPKFQTAVEVAAQNSLFHVIVDTDDTAAQLMNQLERRKLGRVTFLPLNQLSVENVTYPDSTDVAPFLDRCVTYDPSVEKAMKHVFGKKILARSTEAGLLFCKSHNMDSITLEGDLCSRKGALSGGYVDESRSKLKAYYALKAAEKELKDLELKENEMRQSERDVAQQISSLLAELGSLQVKQKSVENMIDQTQRDVENAQARNENRRKQIETNRSLLCKLTEQYEALESGKQALVEEMGTVLRNQLSEEERDLLNSLNQTQTDLSEDLVKQIAVLEEASVEKDRLENMLHGNLLKRKVELEDAIFAVSSNSQESGSPRRKSRGSTAASESTAAHRQRQLELRVCEREEVERLVKESELRLSEAQEEEEKYRQELMVARSQLEESKTKDSACAKALEEAKEKGERLLNKRSMCISKREMYMRKIQELGSLPPVSELSEHSNLGIPALMRSLEDCNRELKKYSHVNKKAYDQYVNFSEQREQLLGRKEELDQGADKVKELIDSLDRQKDEAINRTFRGVSTHFKDVFSELVPNGGGELILRTALDDSLGSPQIQKPISEAAGLDEADESMSKASSGVSVSLYRGVEVKVRFSPVGENYLMSQLSGGQKALVAMALIFSIQRCDPAPFYIFDELDQALDSTYRAAVAGVIQRQASREDNPTQFICSTFRPELVSVASRCYGISHQNKESKIHMLSKNDAMKFVANLMSEEEQVGDVSAAPTAATTSRSSVGSKAKRTATVEESPTEADVDNEKDSPVIEEMSTKRTRRMT